MQASTYISVKEAIDTTGVSDATIRRLCKKGIEGTDFRYDEDGKLILLNSFLYQHYKKIGVPKQPSHLPMQDDILLKQNGAIPKQNGDLPMHLPMQDPNMPSQEAELPKQEPGLNGYTKEYYQNLIAAKDYTIQAISGQLQTKDQQLQERDQQINQLLERDRESNIIIQSLQDKFTKRIDLSQASQSTQDKKEVKIPMIDKVLIGVAVLSSLALFTFLAIMIWAYLSR